MTDDLTQYGLGGIPSPADPRDFQVELDMATGLEPRYIVPGMGPLLNQGASPHCGGYSGVGLKQHQEKADGNGVVNFDPVWLYQHAQRVDGLPNPHLGTTGRGVMKVLHKEGAQVKGKPGTAPTYRIRSYAAVPFRYDALKRAIAQYDSPVLVGADWFSEWFRVRVLPRGRTRAGGHLFLAIGWDDAATPGGALICRNSWGRYPGSGNGQFYGPAPVLVPHIHDAWKALDVKEP